MYHLTITLKTLNSEPQTLNPNPTANPQPHTLHPTPPQAQVYHRQPFIALATSRQLTEYVVLDIEPLQVRAQPTLYSLQPACPLGCSMHLPCWLAVACHVLSGDCQLVCDLCRLLRTHLGVAAREGGKPWLRCRSVPRAVYEGGGGGGRELPRTLGA